MKLIIAGAVLALGLSGCAPTMESANEVGGQIKVGTGLNKAAAFKKADDHCRQYGKAARISGENIWDSTMTFDCVATNGG